MKDVDDHIGSTVQQNYVARNQNVRALWGRRRQAAFQVYGNRLEALLEAWWERAAAHKLLFQSRRQTIFFGEAWG